MASRAVLSVLLLLVGAAAGFSFGSIKSSDSSTGGYNTGGSSRGSASRGSASSGSAAPELAQLYKGQEEWPGQKGRDSCPLGLVEDLRPAAKSQWRSGWLLCVKGNIANCVKGTEWFMAKTRTRPCAKCVCKNTTADCDTVECPADPPHFHTSMRYRNTRKKIGCDPRCELKMRTWMHAICDCHGIRVSHG